MDTLTILGTTILSSGLIGFGMKIYIEKYLKSYFDENFERKKAEIEIQKNMRLKTEEAKLSIARESLNLLSQGRRTCRYMLSLLGNYLAPAEFQPYQKYLLPGDKSLEIKDIFKKIEQLSSGLSNIRNKLGERMDLGHADNSRFTHKYLHDTYHLYNNFSQLIYEIEYSPTQNSFNYNIIKIGQILDVYMDIDQLYKLTKNTIDEYFN